MGCQGWSLEQGRQGPRAPESQQVPQEPWGSSGVRPSWMRDTGLGGPGPGTLWRRQGGGARAQTCKMDQQGKEGVQEGPAGQPGSSRVAGGGGGLEATGLGDGPEPGIWALGRPSPLLAAARMNQRDRSEARRGLLWGPGRDWTISLFSSLFFEIVERHASHKTDRRAVFKRTAQWH